LYDAEKWTLQKVDQEHLGSLETWWWRRTEKISWSDHVRNEETLQTVRKDRKDLHTIKTGKATWISHILHRNCLLNHVIEGKI
jgi:hypothetical protein